MNISSAWLPSHVRVTISQARELLLKNKSSSSELYVIVNTDKDKFVTNSVQRSTQPRWDFINEIPLMSLDTTLHFTVRQTARLSDEFIGYISVPLSGFKLSSKQVTHWYKLGSRPGKNNLKLRGDLQITIQLLSNWVQPSEIITSRKIFPVSSDSNISLKRSKSEIKSSRSESLPTDELLEMSSKSSTQPKSKVKDKVSAFRKSLRKKNKSPVFAECSDDFATFTPPSQHRARSNTVIGSEFSSPGSESLRPSVQALFAEAAVLEEECTVDSDDSLKMSPRYSGYRNSKKRWSAQTLPLSPAPHNECNTLTPDSLKEDTYIAKTTSPMISRNRTKSPSAHEPLSNGQPQSEAEPLEAGDVKILSENREPESGYNTSSSVHKVKAVVENESSSQPKKATVTRSKSSGAKPTKGPAMKRTVTSPTAKNKPATLDRKNTATQSPTRQKTRTLSTSTVTGLKREPVLKTRTLSNKTTTTNKSPGLSRTPSGSKQLNKSPRSVVLREKAPLKRRPQSMIDIPKPRTEPVKPKPAKKISKITENIVTDCPANSASGGEAENKAQENEIADKISEESKPETPSPADNQSEPVAMESNTQSPREELGSPVEICVQRGSSEEPPASSEQPPDKNDSDSVSSTMERRTKHTVAYADKDGFQPVSLLPPSLMNYQSSTLPSRGKAARQLSYTTTDSSSTIDSSASKSNSHEELVRRSVSLRQSSRSPDGNRVIHRRSMNLALLASYQQQLDGLSTIPQSPPALEQTDGDDSSSRISVSSTISTESRPSTPATPATPNTAKYGGRTPEEIASNALKKRKPTGGFRQAINMYQENKIKQKRDSLTQGRTLQVEEECLDRSTSSAESSPRVRRNRSAASAFTNIKNPFSSLRRTKSHNSSSTLFSDLNATDSGSNTDLRPPPALRAPPNSVSSLKPQASGSDVKEPVETTTQATQNDSSNNQSTHETRESTPMLTDTSSIKTLTESESQSSANRVCSPNPAGAVTGSHVRHTTASSIASEGIGSWTSEELSLDDLAHQDWARWTKEELVKELILSKQRLKSTESELKDVKTYLDNLLLRIMDQNPSLLNAVHNS